MARLARAKTSNTARTGRRSGSSQFVSQVVYTHGNHTIASRMRVCNAPDAVGVWRKCNVSWVIANTYTRSKKSSMFVTRSAPCLGRSKDVRRAGEDDRFVTLSAASIGRSGTGSSFADGPLSRTESLPRRLPAASG